MTAGTTVVRAPSITDTYHGYFAEIVPDRRIVEITEFETEDPSMQGEMMMTTSLETTEGGTEVSMRFENLPSGVSRKDNEIGTRMSLSKLAKLVDSRQ
jgi:hypothetical protein